MNEIIVALITGGITLVGVLVSNSKAQAVTDTKLEELTRGGPGAVPGLTIAKSYIRS